MATEFKLPELGEGVDSADVARIHVSEGDQIEAEQNVMELETEKAVADLPCPHAGKIAKVHVSEGDTVEVGQTLLTLEEVEAEEKQQDAEPDDEGAEEAGGPQDAERQEEEQDEKREDEKREVAEKEEDTSKKEAKSKEKEKEKEKTREKDQGKDKPKEKEAKLEEKDEKESREEAAASADAAEEVPSEKKERKEKQEARDETEEAATPSATRTRAGHPTPGDGIPPAAGPATRRLARKLGVDLDQFTPPEGGRIRQEDVVRVYVESGKAAMIDAPSLPDFRQFGPTRREPLSKLAQTAARRLSGSWRSVPQVTQHGLADITDLEAARRRHSERASESAPKITLTSIAVKSIVGLLREFPKFNASLDYANQELIVKSYYHIGIAVDTDHGLLVPVLRDVDRKSIEQIAAELEVLARNARQRKLGKGDFEGATFTISNQGAIGGGEFTPLVNFPEIAILGLARARPELRMMEGRPAERLMLPLSLSYDHRVVNGADAARFVDRLTKILADEFTLLVTT